MSASTPCATGPVAPARRRLRHELLWVAALTLVLLFMIKTAFFPARLSEDVAARGMADRMASRTETTLINRSGSDSATRTTKRKH